MSSRRRPPANKQDDDANPPTDGTLNLLRRRVRGLLLILLVAAGLVAAGRWTWQYVGTRVTAGNAYRLDPKNIEISPQPDWIRSDVRAEVIQAGSIDRSLSMLDPELSKRICDAFELHSWVRSARVTKVYPARVRVELEYRRPVVMVQPKGGSKLDLLPFDADGVRLPSGDLSAMEKRRYPRLVGVANVPLVGGQTSDPRVADGARLALALSEVWRDMGLTRIVPAGKAAASGEASPPLFELATRGNRRILWGAAPGSKAADEPAAEDKLARLRRYWKEHGTLEGTGVLDVRRLPPVRVSRGEQRGVPINKQHGRR